MRSSKCRLSWIHLFFLLFFAFMMHRILFVSSGSTEKVASYVAYPFIKFQSFIYYPFSKCFSYIQSVEALESKINLLQHEKDSLNAQLIELQSCQSFYQDVKEVIDYAQRYSVKKHLLAQILLCNMSEKEDVIIIDAGSCRGVCKNDIALYKNMIIGRVIEVYPWYSKVALLTDKRCKISAESKKGIEGICCGANNGKLDFNFVPHFKDVQVADTLVSTGQGLLYPKGFALGIVTAVESDNVSHFIQAKPLCNAQQLSYVYVVSRQLD